MVDQLLLAVLKDCLWMTPNQSMITWMCGLSESGHKSETTTCRYSANKINSFSTQHLIEHLSCNRACGTSTDCLLAGAGRPPSMTASDH